MEAAELRSTYHLFEYQRSSWHLDSNQVLTLSWEFRIGDAHTFTPWLRIPQISHDQIQKLGTATLDWYAFQLGLVEMLSYWKTTVSPEIRITAGRLSLEDTRWWKELVLNGLGEFFYQNQIDFTIVDFVTINSTGPDLQPTATPYQNREKSVLIPVGGGKDSAVTVAVFNQALLEGKVSELATVVINPIKAAVDLAELSGLPLYQIERHIDPHLLEMNAAGYLNGHTPFSAMAAWVTTLVAHLHGFQSIAVSNERSSNEGNVRWLEQDINHQYSKTLAFEKAFQEYIRGHISAPSYFSFLRPIYELQIGKIFATVTEQAPAVRSRFRSCNRGQKTNTWCGDCPKCLFAYLILRPFLSYQEMLDIFGRDVLDNSNLYPTLLELIGKAETKPFECVGTHEESLVAAYLSRERYLQENQTVPILLTRLASEFFSTEQHLDERAQQILHSWTDEHSIPTEYIELIKERIHGSR